MRDGHHFLAKNDSYLRTTSWNTCSLKNNWCNARPPCDCWDIVQSDQQLPEWLSLVMSFTDHVQNGQPKEVLKSSSKTCSACIATAILLHPVQQQVDSSQQRDLTLMPKCRCQNWQSAAPPAIVPSRKGLISITFLTVCDAACRRSASRSGRLTASYRTWHSKQPGIHQKHCWLTRRS